VQSFLQQLIGQPVAIQLDYTKRAWVIWQLQPGETQAIIAQHLNSW
jgi:hypothetical protein